MTEQLDAPIVARSSPLDLLIDRLAFAACGANVWPSPYAADYHRAAVRRMLAVMTVKDLRLIEATKS